MRMRRRDRAPRRIGLVASVAAPLELDRVLGRDAGVHAAQELIEPAAVLVHASFACLRVL
jgi:hypothetical protein